MSAHRLPHPDPEWFNEHIKELSHTMGELRDLIVRKENPYRITELIKIGRLQDRIDPIWRDLQAADKAGNWQMLYDKTSGFHGNETGLSGPKWEKT